MATRVIGGGKRSRLGAVLVTFVLAFAVLVLVSQASSIWSSTSGSQVQHAVDVSLSPQDFAGFNHIPPGCRPKYGCQGATTSPRP
jgi:hypothetical protein